MALKVDDRTLETSTTTGTGSLNLAGAKTGYQTFVAGVGDGNTCPYLITDGTDWEVGIGTVTSGTPDQLSRDQVLASSNGDAKVSWGSGSKDVGVVAPAAFFGAFAPGVRSISSGATLTIKDCGAVLMTTGSFTQALPAVSTVFAGWGITVLLTDTGTVTIDPNSAETILGASTRALQGKWSSFRIFCDGTEWKIGASHAEAPARIYTGTYTGDGATSKAITGLGFSPKYVKIWPRQTVDATAASIYESTDTIVDDNASGGAFAHKGAGGHQFNANQIIALGADGFTVDDGGIDSDPNKSGQVYNFLAMG